jgi:hypothetical protein
VIINTHDSTAQTRDGHQPDSLTIEEFRYAYHNYQLIKELSFAVMYPGEIMFDETSARQAKSQIVLESESELVIDSPECDDDEIPLERPEVQCFQTDLAQ